jgi:hypothetical protein
MNPNNNSKLLDSKSSHVFWIVLFSVASILLSGQIDYNSPEYLDIDQAKYRAMAESAPGLNDQVIKPFVFRILGPWLAGLMPFDITINFFIINFITLLLIPFSLYFLLLSFSIKKEITLALIICFVFNRYFFQFYAWNYFMVVDSITLLLLIFYFFLIKKRNWLLLGFLIVLGIFIKEIVLIIIPTAFTYLYFNKSQGKDYLYLTIISLLSFLIFIGIRIFLDNGGGEELLEQFTTRILSSIEPIALTKKMIIAFSPFGLIPFFFYKESLAFFMGNKHLLAYLLLVVLTSVFGDHERLMTPFAPIYLLLIGSIIQKYIVKVHNAKSYSFLISIIILSVLSSFYHLWGIIQLPSRTVSIVTTAIFLILCLVLTIQFKITSPKPSS